MNGGSCMASPRSAAWGHRGKLPRPPRTGPFSPRELAPSVPSAPVQGNFQRTIGPAGPVDHYHVWCDLRPGIRDLDFVAAVQAMLGHMQKEGRIEGFGITRRKLGFGPKEIGEWHIDITTRNLAQLEAAFDMVTPRSGEMERLHAGVWSKVENFRSALYRDFPDANRTA